MNKLTTRFAHLPMVLALVLLMFAAHVQAQQSPNQMIRENVDELMSQLEGRKDYFAQHPDELEALVDDNLEDVADFRYIGASVMGRYFRNATPEQRTRFANVFRQTLIDTYAKGLVTFDYRDLRVLDTQSVRSEGQASVDMEVVATNGEVYPVSYSLRQDGNDEWKVVNVIVNGINLGLTFRNQFDQSMREHNRDYDAVIENWAPEVSTNELESGA